MRQVSDFGHAMRIPYSSENHAKIGVSLMFSVSRSVRQRNDSRSQQAFPVVSAGLGEPLYLRRKLVTGG